MALDINQDHHPPLVREIFHDDPHGLVERNVPQSGQFGPPVRTAQADRRESIPIEPSYVWRTLAGGISSPVSRCLSQAEAEKIRTAARRFRPWRPCWGCQLRRESR